MKSLTYKDMSDNAVGIGSGMICFVVTQVKGFVLTLTDFGTSLKFAGLMIAAGALGWIGKELAICVYNWLRIVCKKKSIKDNE